MQKTSCKLIHSSLTLPPTIGCGQRW